MCGTEEFRTIKGTRFIRWLSLRRRIPLTPPRPRIVVIANVPHPAGLALEMMHPGEANATPPILLLDGLLPRVTLLSRLKALAVLTSWQI
jgi:hypothetical protein